MSRLVVKIFAIAIGIFIFLFSLLLLFTSIFGALRVHNDINLSLEGFMVVAGILFLFLSGLYFMWISFSILILKRITGISMTLLTAIPSLLITFIVCELIKNLWNEPEKGYSFLSKIVLLVLLSTVFLSLFFFISKALMTIFRRGTDKFYHLRMWRWKGIWESVIL